MWLNQIAAVVAVAAVACGAEPIHRRQESDENATYSNTTTGEDGLAFSPPMYPSPWASGSKDWQDAHSRAVEFVKDLTLLEKVNLTTGVGWQGASCVGETGSIGRLDFRGLCLQDGPLGVRNTDFITAFPAGVNTAATWDSVLAKRRADALGKEAANKGVDISLGPVAGALGRMPAAGRNWEAFSPDPYLTGAMIAETVRGIQDQGVIACTKHLVGNEQEHFRQAPEAANYGFEIAESLSSNIDDKTMHELYLWPFADAVRAGTGSIMCSYQQVNNSYGCQNSYVLNYLLKNELDFQGFVLSDWAAQHSGVSSMLAGLDMSMPGDITFNSGNSYWGPNLTIAVANGTVPEWRLDDACVRIMSAFFYVGRDDDRVDVNFNSWTSETFGPLHAAVESETGRVNEHVDVREDHASVARHVALASTVLLKNEQRALPLTGAERRVGIFGEDAGSNPLGANGCPDRGCSEGTLTMGWGSGTVEHPYLSTPEQAITAYVTANTSGVVETVTDQEANEQAVALASQVDVALVFVNANSGEGYLEVDGNRGDRNNLTLWHKGDELIQNVSAVCNNTIVVMHTVGPVLVEEWYDHENITAILWAGLPGQESGNATAEILYGLYNPSGKLPFTFAPTRESYGADVLYEPNNGNGAPQDDFTEGVFIDYRALDRTNTTPIYEFGFGLSYTSFEPVGMEIRAADAEPYSPTVGSTESAPTLSGSNASANNSSYLFPDGDFDRIPLYIYPYLNSTDLAEASADPTYGLPAEDYLPSGATDGSKQPLVPAGGAPGGNAGLWDTLYTVTVDVENTGDSAGEEVVQLYVELGGDQPSRMLRGFRKIAIEPGETGRVELELMRRDLSVWDPASQNWVLPERAPVVHVGSSSRITPLSEELTGWTGGNATAPVGSGGTANATNAEEEDVDEAEEDVEEDVDEDEEDVDEDEANVDDDEEDVDEDEEEVGAEDKDEDIDEDKEVGAEDKEEDVDEDKEKDGKEDGEEVVDKKANDYGKEEEDEGADVDSSDEKPAKDKKAKKCRRV